MECPRDDTVLAFTTGRLPDPQRAEVRAHLEGCPHCRELLRELQSGTEVADPSPEPITPSGPGELLPEALLPGDRVSRYVIQRRLGAGGMGVVFEALDPLLDRRIALKLVRAQNARGEHGRQLRARMLREATAQARLSHPNVVAIHDLGSAGGALFLAMELIDGVPLSLWLRDRQRGWAEVLDAFVQAGRGLSAAHEAGLVHRDFKPGNVLVGKDRRVRVADFGLVRISGPDAGEAPAAPPDAHAQGALTLAGAVLGSPAYMSPEQIDGGVVDARSDVFSYCVSLYEALYGRRPFPGPTVSEVRAAIGRGPLAEPEGTGVPEWLQQAVRRGLRAAPEERWPSMRELLVALRRERDYRGLQSAAELVRHLEERQARSGGGDESDPLVQAAIAMVREIGRSRVANARDEDAAAAAAAVLGTIQPVEPPPATARLLESGPRREVWEGGNGARIELRWAPGAVYRIAWGPVGADLAPAILARCERELREAGRLRILFESREVKSYDPAFRDLIAGWVRSHLPGVEAVHMYGASALLAAAVTLTDLALGGVAHIHDEKASFDEALRGVGLEPA